MSLARVSAGGSGPELASGHETEALDAGERAADRQTARFAKVLPVG
jgi:hypothetical protein